MHNHPYNSRNIAKCKYLSLQVFVYVTIRHYRLFYGIILHPVCKLLLSHFHIIFIEYRQQIRYYMGKVKPKRLKRSK